MPSLDELGIKFGTNKASQFAGRAGHDYCRRLYEPLFEPLRHTPLTLLELGWGGWSDRRRDHKDPNLGGASAAMWREYFPIASINIVDIEPKINTVDGVHLFQGAQDDPGFLTELHQRTGDFDIIIDDCSHLSSKTIASFELLYPRLRAGGLYIVEDLEQSYHAHFYGSKEANPNPDKPRRGGQPTIMQYLKRLADEVNYHHDMNLYPTEYWRGHSLEWVWFVFQAAAVKKAT